ncbi:General transcription factor IIH subunit 2 [Auxenochlorella protothecoides]|uniref:General transcription factor IIH subunit 2 n=1 Tax=Auxenochlorella protothecoides TaxID=3075 RepID=A0A087SAF5_AUXPR|nr:General transcription factor IIH subunit 2 [Auxenochlorella protothecoides]KFM22709.1 General transcription factor IIH subunit 2 [Auxenochlorella protothecoides]
MDLANNPEPDEADEEVGAQEQQAEQLAYEREYEDDYSWEQLQEDDQGNLRGPDSAAERRARRTRTLNAAHAARVQRGLIRYLQVVVDLSRAAAATDMRPLRAAVMAGCLARFIRAFFDENPLSQLGLVAMREGTARVLSPLASSPEAHIARLKSSLDTGGDASLQNALDLAVGGLRSVPPYAQREVLILFAGLSSCDPGDIMASVQAARAARVQVSVVGLSAEVYVCREMTRVTGGRYGVALGESHLSDLVLEHAVPPPMAPGSSNYSLVKMGFPRREPQAPGAAVFTGPEAVLLSGGYTCPQCAARVAELPSQCHAKRCAGCGHDFASGDLTFQCPECRQTYCLDCDAYIHEVLHNCPTCELTCSQPLCLGASEGGADAWVKALDIRAPLSPPPSPPPYTAHPVPDSPEDTAVASSLSVSAIAGIGAGGLAIVALVALLLKYACCSLGLGGLCFKLFSCTKASPTAEAADASAAAGADDEDDSGEGVTATVRTLAKAAADADDEEEEEARDRFPAIAAVPAARAPAARLRPQTSLPAPRRPVVYQEELAHAESLQAPRGARYYELELEDVVQQDPPRRGVARSQSLRPPCELDSGTMATSAKLPQVYLDQATAAVFTLAGAIVGLIQGAIVTLASHYPDIATKLKLDKVRAKANLVDAGKTPQAVRTPELPAAAAYKGSKKAKSRNGAHKK